MCGCPRSGTTWVEELLGAHPTVAAVHESSLFTESGVGPLLADEPAVGGELIGRDDLVAEVRSFAARVLGRALGPQHRYLVEKTPGHLWAVEPILEVFPEARFVEVVRDGRDVCVSTIAAANSWAPEWKEHAGSSVRRAAERWRRYVEEGRRLATVVGDRLTTVRFEDLRADTAAAAMALFGAVGVPCVADDLPEIVTTTDFDARFRADDARFRRGGRVGDWRERFTAADCLVFQVAAGDALVALGYEPDHRWFERHRRRPDRC